ncbi:MAG: hypothetical protein LBS92_03525 [Candidatus Methanoplasma sp.]|jgi:hypothetical protein|nr:hypothetical protein [Candidatus Methanoplasma sp.]
MNLAFSDELCIRNEAGGIIKAAIWAAVVALPALLAVLLFMRVGEGVEIPEFGLMSLLIRWLCVSIAIAAVGFSASLYPPGSKPRLILRLVTQATAVAALWIVTSGGSIDIDMSGMVKSISDDMEGWSVNVRVGLLWFDAIVSAIILIGCLIPAGEYKDRREEYLEKHRGDDVRPTVHSRH